MAIEVLVASYIYKHLKLMCALTALTENKNFFRTALVQKEIININFIEEIPRLYCISPVRPSLSLAFIPSNTARLVCRAPKRQQRWNTLKALRTENGYRIRTRSAYNLWRN